MKREIRFRVWDDVEKKMYQWEDMCWKWMMHQLNNPEIHSVMQYIGIKDKNGKEVYEGDILKIAYEIGDEEEIKVVEYCGHEGYPAFDFKDNEMESNGLSVAFNQNDTFEIIGNIYQNPELLK